ncbi:hypothetical protein NE865_06708 [Phthorimaea operculella]|nr:hypothetical protein NE865_06708 [Phthorimaea operculella]
MDSNIPGDIVTDIDVLKKMEDEHLRLQRQVRAIQADRNNRTMGVHPQFRRSDQLLKVLKSEYLDLAHDLKLASTGAHRKKDKRMKIELRRALLLRNKTEHDHEGGITLMAQLDGLLYRDSKQALLYKKLVNANVGQIKERRAQSEKRLVSTENRLENAKLRFNVVQCENKRIREEIEHMLKDRQLFNQEWAKMISMLCKGKKFLQDLFESSTVAYDLRDEWCSKLRTIQEKGKVDQMVQVQVRIFTFLIVIDTIERNARGSDKTG